MSRILWGVHTSLFLFCVLRYRIPIFIVPWLVLYLIHSYRVWLLQPQTELDRMQSALKSRLSKLTLSRTEQTKILNVACELYKRTQIFKARKISDDLAKVSQQLRIETDSSLIEVLKDKEKMLQSLHEEEKTIARSSSLLEERISLLELHALQETQATLEYQDIEAILNERQALHDIMQRLDSMD